MSQTWSGKSLKKATDRNGVRIILSSVFSTTGCTDVTDSTKKNHAQSFTYMAGEWLRMICKCNAYCA